MVIGVDLGGTNIRAAIEVKGDIYEPRKDFFHTHDTLEATLQQLISFIRPLVRPETRGIGIGVPSVVDVARGIVYNVVNIPSWECVPLKDILEDNFGVPVYINNDVNCFVLGEHRFGSLKNLGNVVGLSCGTGLGAGIIINHELFMGVNCGAGEIGLLPYKDHILEYYVSGNFFSAFYNLTAAEAHERALQADAQALGYWREFGVHMGHAVKNVVYTYDPEAIVLGGSLSKAFQFFKDSFFESLEDFTYPESMKRLKIYQSQNENIPLLGAAALVYSHHPEFVNA